MNLDQIETKCFILALFIRDDGERFLLGSRAYEFVDSQLHFVANSYQNDIVEVQGNDGVMLAGQVRRGTSQPFDGYIGDQTVDRTTIEQYRRDFMKFFRKNHYYKVVYVFPDGSAVQRRNGFIVEAPEVKELYQLFPQYHISMNFEDINYYNYEEDSEGEEIYGESATLKISTAATGGLIWDESQDTTLTGEGSNFTLDGTVGGNAISNVQLKGDTEQQTYSGKNLIGFSTASATSGKFTYSIANDGLITVNGGDGSGSGTTALATSALVKLSTGNKRLTIIPVSGSWTGGVIGINLRNSSDTQIAYQQKYYSGTGTNLTYDYTSEQAGQIVAVRLYVSTAGVYNNFKFYIQLTSGTEDDNDYEPYVGGTASPNPDYPQAVNNVTGEQIVEIYNKNLWDMNSITSTSANVTITGPDSSGEFSLSWTGGFNALLSPITNLDSGSYYAISFKHKGAALALRKVGSTTNLVVTDTDATYTTYSFVISGETGLNFEFIRRTSTTGVTAYVKEFQVEIGANNTPYESHQSYEVNLGKNLFDKDNANTLAAYISSASPYEIMSSSGNTTIYIPCEPNTTYTISKVADNVFRAGTTTTVPADGIPTNNFIRNDTGSSLTLTSSAGDKFIAVFVRNAYSSHTEEDILSSIQIEKGSATTYAPYFEPIELCKIGTYQDYIYQSGGDWYIHKETAKLVFDGSDDEQWGLATSSRFYCNANLYSGGVLPASNADDFNAYCNSLIARDYNTSWNSITSGTVSVAANGTSNPRIVNTDYTTLADFKAWLASEPVVLYYPLAAPTDARITDTALIEQLDALASATTYDGQTIFTVTSENQLAILSLSTVGVGGGGVVWDNYGAEWEEGTGGGPTMVNVDSIDNVYPVLTLTGPAVNPQISVLTTNTTLSYSGTVTASQELKIDMFNKTATLNGASVVGNVSGDWVYLKPGVNRITYTTNNADAPDSTLWWQEIVG